MSLERCDELERQPPSRQHPIAFPVGSERRGWARPAAIVWWHRRPEDNDLCHRKSSACRLDILSLKGSMGLSGLLVWGSELISSPRVSAQLSGANASADSN